MRPTEFTVNDDSAYFLIKRPSTGPNPPFFQTRLFRGDSPPGALVPRTAMIVLAQVDDELVADAAGVINPPSSTATATITTGTRKRPDRELLVALGTRHDGLRRLRFMAKAHRHRGMDARAQVLWTGPT